MNSRLSEELILGIYSFLNVEDLSRVSRVSKEDNRISSDPTLWLSLAKKDFCINIADDENNPAKKQYREIKLGISKEKDRFITEIVLKKIQKKKSEELDELKGRKISNGKGFFSSLKVLIKTRKHSKMVSQKSLEGSCFDQTINTLAVEEKSFSQCYAELLNHTTKEELESYKKEAEKFYNALLSGELSFNPDDLIIDDNNKIMLNPVLSKQEFNTDYFLFGFLTLCKIDAHLMMGILIEKAKSNLSEIQKAYLFKQACLLPCPKIIKKLFELLKVNLNEVSNINGIICSPMFFTLVRMCPTTMNKNKIKRYKEMISFFMENGADISLPMILEKKHLNGGKFKEEHTILQLCRDELNKISQVKDDAELSSLWKMILEHQEQGATFTSP